MSDNSSVASASSSSSSDDEFLTTAGTGSDPSRDREALVRKKLLESFYGASTPFVSEEHSDAIASNNAQQPPHDDDGDSDPAAELNHEAVSIVDGEEHSHNPNRSHRQLAHDDAKSISYSKR